MNELQQKVDKFFKQKNTLFYMKDDLNKATKYYLQQNTIQFKNSGKAATLDSKFIEIKPYIVSIEKYLEEGCKLIQKIYQKGFLETLQEIMPSLEDETQEDDKKLSLDDMIMKIDIYQEIMTSKEYLGQTCEYLLDFKKNNDLKQMQSHENLLID